MNLFIEKSIEEIQDLMRSGQLASIDTINECIKNSEKYREFKFWNEFDSDVLLRRYNELIDSDSLDSKYNSIYSKIQDNLLESNKKRNYKLYGIPFGVKDIINTRDYNTEMGSVIWKNFRAGNDARIISSLLYEKGLVAGKTVTAEFAVHSLNETINPYDEKRTPGTSSSGSAVAVALGVVPFALATQTAGSIIRPASFCGVYGFKPSFGTIPRTGVLKTTDSLDTIGFLCSNVYNLKYVFDILRVKGLDYPIQYEAFSNCSRQQKGDRKWKVAFVKTYTWNDAEAYVKNKISDFVKKLSLDNSISVEEVDLGSIIEGAHSIHETIYDKSLAYYFSNEHNDRSRVSKVMIDMLDHGDSISFSEYSEALELQISKRKQMDELMSKYDVIISMSTSSVAPLRNEREGMDPSLIWTLLGLCSISVPAFEENKIPFGIQFSSRRYNDFLLLSFVEELAEKKVIPKYTNLEIKTKRIET